MGLSQVLGRLQVEQSKLFTRNISQTKPFPGYRLIQQTGDYRLFRANFISSSIAAAFQSVVVTYNAQLNKNVFCIVPDYRIPFLRYRVHFCEKNFPELIPGSHISHFFIVPYLRQYENGGYYKRWRVVVVTDKCQVYHNFPNHADDIAGREGWNDIVHFEESVVWDIPGRLYPSKTADCEAYETYNPLLPESCYAYHPSINRRSKYGNTGFGKFTMVNDHGKQTPVSRFYFPTRTSESNPFEYMGGYEPDYKMTLVGTYLSNKDSAARIVLLATSDGGRSWYNKFEFSDEGVYDFRQGDASWGHNHGNPLDGTFFSTEYTARAFLRQRLLKHENGNTIAWGNPIEVECITNTNPIVVRTCAEHGLENGNILTVSGDTTGSLRHWSCLFSDPESGKEYEQTKLYKVLVKSPKELELYEFVGNPFQAIACRHIHHLNRIRDGWLLGSGEIYPNGWILYVYMPEADTYSVVSAKDSLEIYVLNHGKKSVQRTLGADYLDDGDGTFIFASDHDLLLRTSRICGKAYARNSVGVYTGSVNDLDDYSRFQLLFEATEPAYLFKKIQNRYVFSGQRGEFAVGGKTSDTWASSRVEDPLIRYLGSTEQFHVFDRYILILQ